MDSKPEELTRDAVISAYRRWAGIYDAVFGLVFAAGRRHAARIVNACGGRLLEVGVGTGISLPDYGPNIRVVGVDLSPTLVRLAREADPASDYVVADLADLPFPDGSFDVAIAFNSLMNVADLRAAVREAGRVLTPGGRLCICVTHPLNDAGGFESEDPAAPFVVAASYFDRREIEDPREEGGLRFRFHGVSRPLADYAGALEDAGLLLEALREPVPDEDAADRWPSYRRWRRIPMFLHLRAINPG